MENSKWRSDLTDVFHDNHVEKVPYYEGGCKFHATLEELELDDDYTFCEDLDTPVWVLTSDIWQSDITDKVYIDSDIMVTATDGSAATEAEFERSDYYRWCDDVQRYSDDYRFVEDLHEYYHNYESLYYCDRDGNYYYEEPYSSDGGCDHISDYHCSPYPEDLSGESKYTIGFEIEKTDILGNARMGDYIGSYEMFKGYETDSSCGVEAITNILPLDNEDGRNEVFEMMDDASDIINSDASTSCGCHTALSVKGMTSKDLFSKIRPYMSVVYALYRRRLRNSYCNHNMALIEDRGSYGSSTVRVRSNYIEVRLPSHISSVRQLKNRYDLFYLIVDATVNDEDWTSFINKVTPIIDKMYNINKEKRDEAISFIEPFRKYIVEGEIDEMIEEYIR